MPVAIPSVTRPSSPIQRFSKAYLRKNAAALKMRTIATHPNHFCPMTASRCSARSPSTRSAWTGSGAGEGSTGRTEGGGASITGV